MLSCLQQLKEKGLRDFVIDDSGLFVHALKGFPGVYSSYALRTIGLDGVLRLLDGADDRSAHFECCIGASIGGEEFTVTGRCDGAHGARCRRGPTASASIPCSCHLATPRPSPKYQ